MLSGEQPGHIPVTVQIAVEIGPFRGWLVMPLAMAQTGRSQPAVRLVFGNGDLLLALVAAHKAYAGGKEQTVPGKPPDRTVIVQGKGAHQAFRAEQVHCLGQYVVRAQFPQPQQGGEDLQGPFDAPGRSGITPQGFTVFYFPGGEKAGAFMAWSEIGHIGDLA